ncbi:MAG TPA: hypothetical protein VJS69_13955, partial [Candidatus Krumholzibacteria bacterium]|nr:hypothetical protein [Candidatus Krumholzibacteria bacterium]
RMYRMHGKSWSPVETPFEHEGVLDLWGSDDALFAVGSDGAAAIRKNGIWRQTPTGINDYIYSVWGFDDNHVYAAGSDSNTLLSWDGSSWHPTVIDIVKEHEALGSVWGSTPNDLFVSYSDGLLHYDGRSWQPLERVFAGGSRGPVAGANGDVILLNYAGAVSYRR